MNLAILVILMNLVVLRNLIILVILVNCVILVISRNMVLLVNLLILSYHVILVNLAILLLVIFGDLGNTNGSEESDDSDYFCTLGVSEALSVITVNLTDLVIVVHLVWGVKNVNFWYKWIFEFIFIKHQQISEHICIKEMIATNIGIYSYMIWLNIHIYLYQ